jgi:hypothetical protein
MMWIFGGAVHRLPLRRWERKSAALDLLPENGCVEWCINGITGAGAGHIKTQQRRCGKASSGLS